MGDVSILETTEFYDAVLSMKPRVAVFDCDGTLWSGDAGSSFMHWTVEHGVIGQEAATWLTARYEGYRAGMVTEPAICGEMVQVFAGIAESAVCEAARVFYAERVERQIFPEMLWLVDELRRRDVDIWAVSSTCNWVIEEGARRFGIGPERVLAAKVRIVDGVATEEILDVPTDEGKVHSLAWIGVSAPDAVFGNSVHDGAMLAIARRAFPVNPTAALVERSAREGWSIYWPEAVRTRAGEVDAGKR